MSQLTGFFFRVTTDDRPLSVRSRASLSEQPDTAVVIGEAPDGLPLVLRVRRPGSVEQAVMNALGNPAREALPSSVAVALDGLEAAVRDQGRKIGVGQSDIGSVYRCSATAGSLLGDPLLARMIGAQSPLILPDDRYQQSSMPEQVANTAMLAQHERPVTAMKELDRERYVVVPTGSGPVFVASLSEDEPWSITAEALQPLRLEDLRGLASARFASRQGAVEVSGHLRDERAYDQAVRNADAISWAVARTDVGLAIASLARDVHTLHEEGRVHCDVKPGNSLITREGSIAIDAIGVRAGEQSPGATPGWAAPEQVLSRPVTPATDVYALGLMAASLVGAVIYGEERSFIIPTGLDRRRRLRLLASPDVFLDPSTGDMDDATRTRWCDLIGSSVAFDPAARPADGAMFADTLAELLADAPLAGDIPVAGGPGSMWRNVEVLGRLQPSWVVTDQY